MMHDPFQTYTNLGAYFGIPPTIGLQYPSLPNPSINAVAALNPLLGLSPAGQTVGIPQLGPQQPYGLNPGQGFINPQQLQLASLLASQGGLQNPLLASLLSNPLIAASLYSQAHTPYGGHQVGWHQSQPSLYPQIGQIASPFGQLGGQIGYPLAPQSWIGQGGLFGSPQVFGQGNPFLQQLSQRPLQAQSPWGY